MQFLSLPLSHPSEGLHGTIEIPGDKSISHRSVIFGALANGTSTIKGLLEGEDVKATMAAFKAMGIEIERHENAGVEYIIHGKGLKGLGAPQQALDMGNSGTAMRLMAGLLCGQTFSSTLTGDRSLSSRPMGRIIKPLTAMGADISSAGNSEKQSPPLNIGAMKQAQLGGGIFELPVASAQVKSSILLAGLYSKEEIVIHEPDITRDHTERMLKGLGCDIEYKEKYVRFAACSSVSEKQFNAQNFVVPSDFSSAMFFIVAALITPNSHLTLKNVGMNASRNGGLEILKQLGGNITLRNQREVAGEPVADIEVVYSELSGKEISPSLVALAIDEFPVISVAAALAAGKTIITGAEELRVKESDRISAMVNGLNNIGISASELKDGMIINGIGGQDKDVALIPGGEVESYDDHRIAMSFAVAGLRSEKGVLINECENVATSFPNFVALAKQTGFRLEVRAG